MEGSLDSTQPLSSPSTMLKAEAENIRTCSLCLTGKENLSSGLMEKVPPPTPSTISIHCGRISQLEGQKKKSKILEWVCITLVLSRVSAFPAEVIHLLFYYCFSPL